MFWKKKQEKAESTEEALTERTGKKRSTKECMIKQIEQIKADQSLMYRLCQSYGGGNRVAVVELDSNSHGKDKRYLLSIDTMVDGKPVGAKMRVMKSSDSGDVIHWIREQKGEFVA